MVRMVCKTSFPYKGRSMKAGDVLEAESEQHALILAHSGFAQRESAPQTYVTREMVAQRQQQRHKGRR